ncbi:MerR family transcriptional regulator [Campylobacter upsaliensis]|nr:MerR family transcriptional regulator [Campylobacter upsaliensis]
MAYTIIEVERATNIPSRKIRFWLDKGLFPFIERDENGVRYFAKSDMEWARWIEWLRQCGMSLKEIREYAEALSGGIKTAPKRRALLQKSYTNLQTHIASLQEISQKLKTKIGLYDEMIEKGIDTFNPQSRDYKGCEKQC